MAKHSHLLRKRRTREHVEWNIIHEFSHYFADMEDNGYVKNESSPLQLEKGGHPVQLTKAQCLENANSLAGFVGTCLR